MQLYRISTRGLGTNLYDGETGQVKSMHDFGVTYDDLEGMTSIKESDRFEKTGREQPDTSMSYSQLSGDWYCLVDVEFLDKETGKKIWDTTINV